jgi:hypothetical protein
MHGILAKYRSVHFLLQMLKRHQEKSCEKIQDVSKIQISIQFTVRVNTHQQRSIAAPTLMRSLSIGVKVQTDSSIIADLFDVSGCFKLSLQDPGATNFLLIK